MRFQSLYSLQLWIYDSNTNEDFYTIIFDNLGISILFQEIIFLNKLTVNLKPPKKLDHDKFNA